MPRRLYADIVKSLVNVTLARREIWTDPVTGVRPDRNAAPPGGHLLESGVCGKLALAPALRSSAQPHFSLAGAIGRRMALTLLSQRT